MIDGKPSSRGSPSAPTVPDFIDRLLTTNREFRELMENRRKEADEGKVCSLESIRKAWADKIDQIQRPFQAFIDVEHRGTGELADFRSNRGNRKRGKVEARNQRILSEAGQLAVAGRYVNGIVARSFQRARLLVIDATRTLLIF